jgi:hypothetical protein
VTELVVAKNRQSLNCHHGLSQRQSAAGKDMNMEAENIAQICYHATTSEDTEDSACAVVRSRVRKLVKALSLCIVTIYVFNKSNYQSKLHV